MDKTPVVRVESKKMKINILSAMSSQGKLRLLLYKNNMNAGKLIDFMGRLARDSSRKIFLILDDLCAHHGEKMPAWPKHEEEIKMFFCRLTRRNKPQWITEQRSEAGCRQARHVLRRKRARTQRPFAHERRPTQARHNPGFLFRSICLLCNLICFKI